MRGIHRNDGVPGLDFLLPNQASHSGQSLLTDGFNPYWGSGLGGGGTTLPSTTSHSGQYLSTDGAVLFWNSVIPGGMAIGSGIKGVTPYSVLFADNNGNLAQQNLGLVYWEASTSGLLRTCSAASYHGISVMTASGVGQNTCHLNCLDYQGNNVFNVKANYAGLGASAINLGDVGVNNYAYLNLNYVANANIRFVQNGSLIANLLCGSDVRFSAGAGYNFICMDPTTGDVSIGYPTYLGQLSIINNATTSTTTFSIRNITGQTANTLNIQDGGGNNLLSLDSTAKFSRYNQDLLKGNGIFSIVGSVSQTNKTTSITSTNIFTPPIAGVYKVDIYQVCNAGGTAGTLHSTIGWTDDAQAQTFSPASDLNLASSGTFSQGTMTIKAASGVPITYSATLTGVTGSPSYCLYISAERLS